MSSFYLIMGAVVLNAVSNPRDLGFSDFRMVIALCLMPIVALVLPFITRGEDWAIDHGTGEFLRRGHFLGISSRWKSSEKFDPSGLVSIASIKINNEPSGKTFHMV